MIDVNGEIGKIYGCYEIIEILPVQTHKKRRCICKCIFCGNIREMDYQHVKSRNYKKCPNCNYQYPTKEDLVGKKFGRLTVIKRVENSIQPNKSKKIRYYCQCECGNYKIVTACHLRDGHTTSCGCYGKEKLHDILFQDLRGKKYGKLTVLKQVKNTSVTSWLCQCECGAQTIATTQSLNSGKKLSCGCLVSKAEEEFTLFLKTNNFNFIKQYKFNDCKDKRSLPFDFAILKDDKIFCLVELNGQQHYAPYTYCNESKEIKEKNYNDRLYKDNIKRKYCQDNKIPLLEIKYTDFKHMNLIFIDFYDKLNKNA